MNLSGVIKLVNSLAKCLEIADELDPPPNIQLETRVVRSIQYGGPSGFIEYYIEIAQRHMRERGLQNCIGDVCTCVVLGSLGYNVILGAGRYLKPYLLGYPRKNCKNK